MLPGALIHEGSDTRNTPRRAHTQWVKNKTDMDFPAMCRQIHWSQSRRLPYTISKPERTKWISWFYLPSDGLRLFDPYGTMAGAAWRGGTYLASVVYAGRCRHSRFVLVLLAVTRVALAGSLTGSGQYAGAGRNLTALGNIDWASWGDGGSGSITPSNRKSGGGSLIGASLVGGIITFDNTTNTNGGLYWTDGAPTASQLAANGIETSNGTGGGYSLTFPASTTPHTVYLFLGGRNNFPTLTASLSDGSSSNYTNNSMGASSAPFNVMFVLAYAADSSGQTLTVTYTMPNGTSDVTLKGAAYGTVAPAPGGSISGAVTTQTTETNNLTSLGATDWAEWGYMSGSTTTPSNVKNDGGNTISAQAINSTVTQYGGAAVSVSWANGTPNATGTEATGIYTSSGNAGEGFLMTFPADTNSRTLYILCGGYINVGQLGVALTDGSAAEYLDASQSSSGGTFYALYTITYKAASAGQRLIVSWIQMNPGNHVTISGAAYGVNAQCTSPCVAATTVSSPFGGSATSSPVNTTGATLYVVTLSSYDNLGTATITSSPSQTWTALNYYDNLYAGTGNGVMFYVCGPATSASQAITVTGDYATAVFAAYSGTATSNCFDSPNQDGNTMYNGGSTFQPGGITPSQNGALIVSGLGANSAASSVLIDSGFTTVGTYIGAHFSSQAFVVQPFASAIDPTWTENGDGNAVPYIASFVPASNLAGVPASITATAGSPQSATVNTAFATALQATVEEAYDNPVGGVSVMFAAPPAGAGAAFGGSATATVTTNSRGIATAPTLTGNAQAGSYTVTASVAGVAATASFNLTNTAMSTPTPGSVAANAGTPQSATVGTQFGIALQALVKDNDGNPYSGATVTFTAPGGGASAAFSGSATATAVTDSSGIASAPRSPPIRRLEVIPSPRRSRESPRPRISC